MKKQNRLIQTTLFLISLSLIGCSSIEGPSYGEAVSIKSQKYNPLRMNSVAILDKNLQTIEVIDIENEQHITKSKIAIESLGMKSLQTGNFKVFTLIRNRTDYPQHLDIRTQFYDENKIPIEEPTTWQRVNLSTNSMAKYEEVSISDNVKYFIIEIREGQ